MAIRVASSLSSDWNECRYEAIAQAKNELQVNKYNFAMAPFFSNPMLFVTSWQAVKYPSIAQQR